MTERERDGEREREGVVVVVGGVNADALRKHSAHMHNLARTKHLTFVL